MKKAEEVLPIKRTESSTERTNNETDFASLLETEFE